MIESARRRRRGTMDNSSGGFAILSVAALVPLAVGQHSSMPSGMSHEEHLKQMTEDAELKKRGALAMGFDQDKASHHFYLTEAGGRIIEVGVNETTDAETLRQVHHHLRTISQQFAEGVFTSPVATHAEMPPGAHVMRERKARINCGLLIKHSDQVLYGLWGIGSGGLVTALLWPRSVIAPLVPIRQIRATERSTADVRGSLTKRLLSDV
jgi:hypothetical protein